MTYDVAATSTTTISLRMWNVLFPKLVMLFTGSKMEGPDDD